MNCTICNKSFHDSISYKTHFKYMHSLDLNVVVPVPQPTRTKSDNIKKLEESMQGFFIDLVPEPVQMPQELDLSKIDLLIGMTDRFLEELDALEQHMRSR